MNTRHLIRGILLLAVVVSTGNLVTGWLESSRDIASVAEAQTDRAFDDRSAVVAPRDGPTVITTDPPGSGNGTAAIIAFAPDGRVRYFDDTYGNYFDVDPSPAGSQSVSYVAGTRFDPCPSNLAARTSDDIDDECALIAVERVNLSTGVVTRLHTAVSGWDIWHDVDLITGSRVAVADIEEDRVFVLNTTTGTVEWQWHAERDLRESSGGRSGDWTHLNDVEVLDDGRLMVSLRNQDRIVFLDRHDGLIEDWTLGGEDDYDVLYEQHNPDYIPPDRGGPAVVVADSENNRVAEYQRTADGWRRTWQWRDGRLRWPRDADRLPNGHTLVTDSQGNRVLEVTGQGAIVWSVTVGTPYEAERLGTGAESTTGHTASALGYASPNEEPNRSTVDGSINPSRVTSRVIAFVTGPGVNGVLYIAPSWVTIRDVPALVVLIGSLLAWIGLELFWWPSFGLIPWNR